MTRDLRCPSCGEEDDLRGRRGEEGIETHCDLVADPKPQLQKARGDQMSVVGYRASYLCASCDADKIQARKPRSTLSSPEDPWK